MKKIDQVRWAATDGKGYAGESWHGLPVVSKTRKGIATFIGMATEFRPVKVRVRVEVINKGTVMP